VVINIVRKLYVRLGGDLRILNHWYSVGLAPSYGTWLHDEEDVVMGEQPIMYQYQPDDPEWKDPDPWFSIRMLSEETWQRLA